jgi:hypothetical protein
MELQLQIKKIRAKIKNQVRKSNNQAYQILLMNIRKYLCKVKRTLILMIK